MGYLPEVLFFNAFELGMKRCIKYCQDQKIQNHNLS